MRIIYSLLLLLIGFATPAQAEQPIFSEMPRWSGGWGVQVLQEYRHEKALYDGKQNLGSDLNRSAYLLHVEGVKRTSEGLGLTKSTPPSLFEA